MTEPVPGKSGEARVSDIATLPFEAAMSELEAIVRRLEEGRVELEESIAIFERGEALKRHCETLLRNAEARIEKIALGPDGAPTGVVPLDPQE
ncbi:exodeoxyribonuclease 7 small subunit [Camelimonas fluminis]|uniref:Exodeoxyribonuclease 7 small subunit n=1 Tax=Camelimonas fluminis TaxID=1576911 RepID=A0ABV7UD42_9HYPH|nr:exodeoxyribonuclease VII small subunit [Camelimonas fluminis]GHE47757.1 exodeoxyribonuclease 7 small subunit [Camelimonas fluminis]